MSLGTGPADLWKRKWPNGVRKSEIGIIWSQTMWNHANNWTEQLKRPTSLISYWFSGQWSKMDQNYVNANAFFAIEKIQSYACSKLGTIKKKRNSFRVSSHQMNRTCVTHSTFEVLFISRVRMQYWMRVFFLSRIILWTVRKFQTLFEQLSEFCGHLRTDS